MPIGFKAITGLTHNQGNAGMAIGAIPGDSGGPISAIQITALGFGLPPNDPSLAMIVYPNGSSVSTGTDSDGNISASITLVNSGNDITFAIVGGAGGNIDLVDGVWAQLIRGYVNHESGTRGFGVQFTYYEITDFLPGLTVTPTNLVAANTAWDPEWGINDGNDGRGNTDLTWDYDNTLGEDPLGFAIVRDGVLVATVPFEDGVTTYEYTDYVFEEDTYEYWIITYKYLPDMEMSLPSDTIEIEFGGDIVGPAINVTGNINVDISFISPLVFISDPSGIYTLVPGKADDTIYNRPGVTVETIHVKIPDPYAKIGYLP